MTTVASGDNIIFLISMYEEIRSQVEPRSPLSMH